MLKRVFNADESGFIKTDPSCLKAIGEKGKTLNHISGGSGRDSIRVLACISADGSCVPPFIVFKGTSFSPELMDLRERNPRNNIWSSTKWVDG